MDIQDGLEIVVGHRPQRGASNDARVVDEDVDSAVAVERSLHDRLAAGRCRHRVGACDRITTGGGDLVDHFLVRVPINAVAGQAPAGIVDDDLRPTRRQQQGVGAPQVPARRR